jgi:type IV pilus assembly protein PilC
MQFTYIARDKNGEIHTGKIKAYSQEEAVAAIQKSGLILISCQSAEHLPLWMTNIKIFQRVKGKDIVNFSRELATLFSAKVSLVESLRVLSRQQDNSYFSDVLAQVASDVEAGTMLSRALAKHLKIFSVLYVNIVKTGEVSGNLENSLNYLADHLEKQYYLASKVRGAMIYPAFISAGFIVVAVLMLIFVIPNLTGILKESGQELPWSTKAIIFLSDALKSWGWLVFLVFAGIVTGAVYYRRTPEGKTMFDKVFLKIPVFGKVLKKFYLARFSENLSTLIKGGLPILQALQTAGDVVGNDVYRNLIFEAKDEVKVGNSISSVFRRYEEIPVMMTQMIYTGEKTGQLDMVLQKLSRFYSVEVDNIVTNISALIEPVLIVFLGVGVAILLMAILMPIYNMGNAI